MPLNIIMRGQKVDWQAVSKEIERRKNERINAFNKENWKKAAAEVERAASVIAVEDSGKDGRIGFAVPVAVDDMLAEMCDRENGHRDWKRDSHFFKRAMKQPEFAALPKHYQRGIDRITEESR